MVLFFVIVNAAAKNDWKEQKIPNASCIEIVLMALLGCVTMPEITLLERLLGGVIVSVPMFLAAVFVKGSFGGGDIKLMAACGLFLGWKLLLSSFAIAVGIAAVYGVGKVIRGHSRRTQIPMGPFLEMGMLLGMLLEEITRKCS